MGTEMAAERSRPRRLAELYAEHAPSAGRLAYLLVGDAHIAEDITQEAFVRVAGHFLKLRDPDAFGAYLRRTVVNLSKGHMRRMRRERDYARRQQTKVQEQTAARDPAAHEDLVAALTRLPHRQKAALVLRFYEDLSEQRTAELLDCPVGTVKSLVSRGLAELRRTLMVGD